MSGCHGSFTLSSGTGMKQEPHKKQGRGKSPALFFKICLLPQRWSLLTGAGNPVKQSCT